MTYEFRPFDGVLLAMFPRIMFASSGNGRYGVLVERVNTTSGDDEWSTYIETGSTETIPFFSMLKDPNAVLTHGQIA